MDGPVCIGSPAFNLVATPAGGTWSGPGIVNATTGLFNASFAGGPGIKTITYGFVSGGCNITTTMQIEVQASVNSSITNAPAVICDDATVVDLNAATGGGTWSGTGITDAATGIFDSSVSGYGEFEVTYSIPNVCNGTSTATIAVVQAGPAQITNPGTLCESQGTVFLQGSPSNGTWAGTGVVDPATGEFDPAVSGGGIFNVSYNFDPNGCITSSNTDIEVTPSANTSIIDPGTICESFGVVDIALTNEAANGTWSGNGITNPATGTFDPSITGGGIQTVFFTVPNTCDGELSLDINVVPDEPTVINDPGAICVSSTSVILTSNIIGGAWTGGGITNGTTGEFSPASAGLGATTITFDPDNQCSETATIDIVVNPDVDPTITDVNPICEDADPIQLQSVDAGGTWSGNGVDPNTGIFNPGAASIGSNTISYTFSGACTGQDQITIDVVAQPTLVLQTTAPICVNNTNYQLTATPAGGTWSGPNVSASGVFNAQAAGVGPQSVTYSVGGVCAVSTDFNLSVVALPTVTASADDAICVGESITISASGAVSYSWSSGSQSSNATVQPNTTTTYTVTGTDANGCQNTDQVVITVNPLPVVTATVNDNSICEGEQVTLTATGLVNYNWTSSQNIQNANNNIATSTPANSAIFTVSGTDANGCGGSAQVSVAVTIINTIFSTIGGFNNELVGPVTFQISSNATSFDWDFGNGETEEGIIGTGNVEMTYNSPGLYDVIVTSYLGECSQEDQIILSIDEDVVLIVPNVITINGDGLNDVYRVMGRCIDTFDMLIYTRYGELVAEIHDYDRFKPDPLGIYGSYNNDPYDIWAPRNKLNPGTYFYHYEMVDCASRKVSKTGEITVLDGK
ncbi:MAG: gliding motility-associated C-terminal domain-containing protein [Flavobacteriales bacterium]